MPRPSSASASLPERFPPQLVLNATRPPKGKWFWEVKFDGYRIMVRILNGRVTLYTKNRADWTHKFRRLAGELESFGLPNAWLDGEAVVTNNGGLPDFGALQEAIASGDTDDVILYLFDLMYLNKADLRSKALEHRRAKLHQTFDGFEQDVVRLSEAFEDAPIESLLASACAMGLEGLVGKKAGSVYSSSRNGDWVKLKCKQRQEFVIAGYTSISGGTGVGSLVIARYDEQGRLVYSGRVGSGISAKASATLSKTLKPHVIEACPLSNIDEKLSKSAVWVQPIFVCEIRYAELTKKGQVRHGVYMALRSDTPAKAVMLE